MGLSKSAQNFTVGFLKLLSTHPIHIVVWGNFPFNEFYRELHDGTMTKEYNNLDTSADLQAGCFAWWRA